MKSWPLIILFLFAGNIPGFSQSFSKVDKHALKAPKKISKDLPKLTTYLTNDFQTDLKKVRSMYIWIAHNIEYDQSAYKKNTNRVNQSNQDVLNRRKAVCFGYSTLFKEMCDTAGILCEVIYGYPKNPETGVANLSSTSHAWNAVRIDGSWQLLDITWGSGNGRKQLEDYFLPPPENIIYSHLPADPMWQLLDCPVKPGIFRKAKGFIAAYISSSKNCIAYQDSIDAFLKLPLSEKRLQKTFNAYSFNPVAENKEELGHAYMDHVSTLLDRSTQLEMTDSTEAIKSIYLEIIATCKEAERYIELYDHQKENLAYSHSNYAIALSKEIQKYDDPQPVLEEMKFHFEKALAILEGLPKNILLENALLRFEEYLEWVQEY